MSLASLLSIARSALIVQQRSMEVTGHNVANANTPGYSRQQLQLQAASPLQMPMYSLGRGVEANVITRSRDQFYDASYRSDSGLLGQSNTLGNFLGQVQSALNEPSSDGLASALDGLFGSLSDLAGDPTSSTNRGMVVAKANRLVQQFHSIAAQVSQVKQESVDNLHTQVDQVNSLATQIASLNQKIVASNGPGGPSSDLMDQRDVLVDQISQYMNVRVLSRSDGSIGVAAGDTVLVDGANTTALSVGTVGAGWGVVTQNGGTAVDPQSGSLKALCDMIQTKIPDVTGKLDAIASSIVTEFNRIHHTGTTPAGATNVDFFDPAGTTATTINLSAALTASSDNIAASATGVAGNGDIATQLANLATTGVASLGGSTFRESFTSLASGVGIDVNNATQDTSAQQALVDRDDQARTSVSGVNTDEEMVNLIQSQQAYQAAAKLISVADQMVQQMIQIIGN